MVLTKHAFVTSKSRVSLAGNDPQVISGPMYVCQSLCGDLLRASSQNER